MGAGKGRKRENQGCHGCEAYMTGQSLRNGGLHVREES